MKKFFVTAIIGMLLLTGCSSSSTAGSNTESTPVTSDAVSTVNQEIEETNGESTEESSEGLTGNVIVPEGATESQKQALRSALNYLDFTAFSRQGLIDQLSSDYGDQFSVEDATWAADNCGADWNAEALESAKNYLDMSGFSYKGLYDQLTSQYGEKFTTDEAQYAVDNCGADWNAEAVECANNYLEMTSFSRQGLIDQLSSEYGDKFTVEQATYAADQVGL